MFDNVRDVSPAKQICKLKVRVIRLWKMVCVSHPDKALAMEMVLIDSFVRFFFPILIISFDYFLNLFFWLLIL